MMATNLLDGVGRTLEQAERSRDQAKRDRSKGYHGRLARDAAGRDGPGDGDEILADMRELDLSISDVVQDRDAVARVQALEAEVDEKRIADLHAAFRVADEIFERSKVALGLAERARTSAFNDWNFAQRRQKQSQQAAAAIRNGHPRAFGVVEQPKPQPVSEPSGYSVSRVH